MKKNLVKSSIILLFLLISTITIQAYNIDILTKNYELTDTTTQGSQNAYFYTIFITVQNEGTEYSDDIVIELIDELDIPTIKNYTFSPSEIKTFQFKDYPLVGQGPHEITINYYPSNESRINQGNSGSTSMIIDESQDSSSTPYVSVSFIICLLLIITTLRKKQLKNKREN